MLSLQEQKVLLLHPFLNFYGGAEYLLSVVANKIFPQSSIYTFSYRDEILREMGISKERIVSPFGSGVASSFYSQMTPLYPALIDTLSLDEYDLVLSFSYGYVHGVVTGHEQPHISYIQTPMRLLWLHESDYYWYDKMPLVREVYRSILAWQRVWDRQAATRPDYLLSNSQTVQKRIQTFWGREAAVVYPPVDTDFYQPPNSIKKEEYFVTHSRLVRYKNIDILIDACRSHHKKLMIIGDGPDYKRLKRSAKGSSDITFTGYISHEEKRNILQKARGFLFAAEEDFGIAPVEALAAGTPVLAFGKGGVLETVTPDTGMFFKEQRADSVAASLSGFSTFTEKVSRAVLLAQAAKFSQEHFITSYLDNIKKNVSDFLTNGPPVIV